MNMIDKWKKEMERITSDAMDALESQFILNRVREIVSANAKISTDNLFWDHFVASFGAYLVLGIWRQIDERTEVVSLLKLLKEIKENPKVITKTWFADQYARTLPREIGEQHFAEHFGSGEEVDGKILDEDIQKLKSATAKVARFRHTRIAHKNADERLVVDLNFKEVEEALKVIEELVIKYQLLINQSGYAQLMPVIQYNWESIFRTPWIENEHG